MFLFSNFNLSFLHDLISHSHNLLYFPFHHFSSSSNYCWTIYNKSLLNFNASFLLVSRNYSFFWIIFLQFSLPRLDIIQNFHQSILLLILFIFFSVDIKSIIAYSTISQIGYMLLAAIIVPSSSIFHILVHAFFKSLLFLLAADIIHNSQAKVQSIYTLKINNSLLRAYFLLLCLLDSGYINYCTFFIESH